jgi:hypothetical protein
VTSFIRLFDRSFHISSLESTSNAPSSALRIIRGFDNKAFLLSLFTVIFSISFAVSSEIRVVMPYEIPNMHYLGLVSGLTHYFPFGSLNQCSYRIILELLTMFSLMVPVNSEVILDSNELSFSLG